MTVLAVPELEETPWPTLGPQVCAWIEAHLVHGPGDLRGLPAKIDQEKRALIYRMYEVYPRDHPQAGRRRFKRVAISLRKGTAKTEFAAWIAAAELDIEAPVRCAGFDQAGNPIGRSVVDPYIPLVAYTEEQSEDLAYGALLTILEHSKIVARYDLGLDRIMRIKGDGKAAPFASAPSSRDGARTTFQHFDETHRLTLPRLRDAHATMLANIPKRFAADAWTLETTTAPAPGEDSIAERTMEYAQAVAEGRTSDARLFFFHRQASDSHDLATPEGLRTAIVEASGPAAEWSDIDGIAAQWDDPKADRNYLERVWLNRPTQASARAFDVAAFRALERADYQVADGAVITLGFDGARYQDSTALVGTEVATGYQWVVGVWEKPYAAERGGLKWEVPEREVCDAVEAAFERWQVWRMYADPPFWETTVATWAGKFGDPDGGEGDRVVRWYTNRWQSIAYAVRAYVNAMLDRHLSHDGGEAFVRHVGNAHKQLLHIRDDKGVPLWAIKKSRPDSTDKIDVAVAAILSWQARCDAITKGVGRAPSEDWDGEIRVLA